ncbi:hypothetical protein AQF52_0096 [Streptomyces venezuelae]|uniref:hypothetical protein n=1 Tax=Streptomyces gardneri TaxID=66892 RepID=UPI0006E21751|nr:hypothetical protein [Streptomyces gardneri]ALO05698.1 hypothetical protein AQF52_0096 [Streptomyces venezuelae]QPK43280.1 hypothetical protein H4W23_00480 [Streptomyces gardneri]WRK34498.1 hypothetical protein U0M97_00465 [Streptomyces venezuelae]
MATNLTTKKPAAPAADETADIVTQPAPAVRPPALARRVGPAVDPVTIRLTHHHEVDGTTYAPGDELLVDPEYVERLRAQGYAQP